MRNLENGNVTQKSHNLKCNEVINAALAGRPVVVCLRVWPIDRRVAGLIPESTNFLTNSSGQVTNALASLFTKQCKKLVPAS